MLHIHLTFFQCNGSRRNCRTTSCSTISKFDYTTHGHSWTIGYIETITGVKIAVLTCWSSVLFARQHSSRSIFSVIPSLFIFKKIQFSANAIILEIYYLNNLTVLGVLENVLTVCAYVQIIAQYKYRLLSQDFQLPLSYINLLLTIMNSVESNFWK